MISDSLEPKILFVLYQFPPSNDVGAQRPVRFIRHLHRSGWQVYVVAPANGVYHSYAPQTVSEIENFCRVVRAPMIFPAPGRRSSEPGALVSLAWRAWNRFAMPDGALAWLPAAVSAGIRTVRRHRIPLVLASGQPFTTFLAAAIVGRNTPASVILDYRDLWSLNPFYKRSRPRLGFEAQLEKFTLRSAAAAVFVTDECRRIQTAGLGSHCRYLTITNGFEPIVNAGPARSEPGFRIIHAGNFYGNRSPEVFFRGLAEACARSPALADDVRVEFYGVYDRRKFHRCCQTLGLTAKVSLKPRIPRSEMLQKLRRAAVLLLVNSYGPGHEMFLPAKFFDYLAVEKPILCLAEDGALKSALNRTGAGVVADPRDAAAVSRAILNLYEKLHRRNPSFHIDPQKSARYRASQTGEQLARLCRRLYPDGCERTVQMLHGPWKTLS